MFLIPGLVITFYITKTPFPPGYREELVRYLKNRAHKVDGGWGMLVDTEPGTFGGDNHSWKRSTADTDFFLPVISKEFLLSLERLSIMLLFVSWESTPRIQSASKPGLVSTN